MDPRSSDTGIRHVCKVRCRVGERKRYGCFAVLTEEDEKLPLGDLFELMSIKIERAKKNVEQAIKDDNA